MKVEFDLNEAFGDTPIPRPGYWTKDILGAGFSAQAIQLLPDEDGENLATLIRHEIDNDPYVFPGTPAVPKFRALYIHGWNDYFYQPEMARHIALAGGQFYALDLRKYGRSLRPGQIFGWVTDLSEYDEEISEALDIIGDDLPILLMAHSTGGLTTVLFAHHHPGRFAGVWLNSPWLELHPSALMRYATGQIVDKVAPLDPHMVMPVGGNNFFSESLDGWQEHEGTLPEELQPFADDPSVAGWKPNRLWKGDRVTLAGWLHAISNGHRQVAAGLNLDCPVICFASTASFEGDTWTSEVRYRDTVLDVDAMVYRAGTLGNDVTIRRVRGVHDLTLSFPPVRQELWAATHRWLQGVFPANPISVADIPLAPR